MASSQEQRPSKRLRTSGADHQLQSNTRSVSKVTNGSKVNIQPKIAPAGEVAPLPERNHLRFQNQQGTMGSDTRSSKLSGLKIASHPVEHAHLVISPDLPPFQQQRILEQMQAEIIFQEKNPPSLPPSQIRDLEPKQMIEEWKPIPENCDPATRKRIEDENNAIAAKHQQIDRERNNQAAKKSRETRVESLNNARAMLNEKAAEITWLRLKVLSLGGDPAL